MKTKLQVGQIINSTSCGAYEVTNLDTAHKASVRFIDTGYEAETDKHSVSKGNIKDPYFPQVLGVGYLGAGKYVSKLGSHAKGFNNTPEYNAWINMMQRCYYDKYVCREQGYQSYDTVTVWDGWHNFQNFAEWYCTKRNPLDNAGITRPNLDKEILSSTSPATLYSPETCCVVPSEINAMLIGLNRYKSDGLPRGVIKVKERYRIAATSSNKKHICNKFDSIEECIKWRDSINQERYTFLANKYKDVLESRVYEVLTNWDKF